MKNADIAARILSHLKRFESDPVINVRQRNLLPYWNSSASESGRYVYVQYIGYQGQSHLTKAQALVYLAWLDAGNVGRHYQALEAKSE
jgi:hypothetical protein